MKPPSVTRNVAGRVLYMSGVSVPKLMSAPKASPTLKQPLMNPASKAMASPLGKLKSFTAVFFSSSERKADFIEPAMPMMDAHERHHHAENHAEGEARQGVHLGEEDVEQHGGHDGAQPGTGTKGDALS